MIGSKLIVSAVVAAVFSVLAVPALAQGKPTEIMISVKDNQFEPKETEIPANTPIVIKFKNLDSKPMEAESKDLRFEKIVPGGGEVTVNVRPQKPGRYEFYDDFHEDTTRGALIVK